jgi:hypothetical protein
VKKCGQMVRKLMTLQVPITIFIIMANASAADYRPLLAPGLHKMTMLELRKICVTNFNPLSTTRDVIMNGLEYVHHNLNRNCIIGELWVDGSFLTNKVDPADVDIVLCVDGPFIDNASATQQAVVQWVAGNLKASLMCDSFVCAVYPPDHAKYVYGRDWQAYWRGMFCFSRRMDVKGLAVINC